MIFLPCPAQIIESGPPCPKGASLLRNQKGRGSLGPTALRFRPNLAVGSRRHARGQVLLLSSQQAHLTPLCELRQPQFRLPFLPTPMPLVPPFCTEIQYHPTGSGVKLIFFGGIILLPEKLFCKVEKTGKATINRELESCSQLGPSGGAPQGLGGWGGYSCSTPGAPCPR